MSIRPNRLLVWFAALAVGFGLAQTFAPGQGITIPNTFTNNTVADATQVNANFSALAANALNRNGGTMNGDLLFTDALYDIGKTAATRPRDFFLSRNATIGGTLSLTGNLSSILSAPCTGRLTLTSGTPVTSADVTGGSATTVYFTPNGAGNICGLFDGSSTWTELTFAEASIAVPATTSTMYDVFAFNSSGTLTLEALAWTNDTTRATALALQNGHYVKSGATTRLYLGSFRTTTVSGQTEDSVTKRYVWNYFTRVPRVLRRLDTTATWTYSSTTIHQANAAPANQVEVVIGLAETAVSLTLLAHKSNDTLARLDYVGIGEDSTTAFSSNSQQQEASQYVASYTVPLTAAISVTPAIGRRFFAWLEATDGVGATTWYGQQATSTNRLQSGLSGTANGM